LKIINLAKETRNSGVYATLLQGASQQLPDQHREAASKESSRLETSHQ